MGGLERYLASAHGSYGEELRLAVFKGDNIMPVTKDGGYRLDDSSIKIPPIKKIKPTKKPRR